MDHMPRYFGHLQLLRGNINRSLRLSSRKSNTPHLMQQVDDTDSRIQYSPATAWTMGGLENEYNHTSHRTNVAGAQMSFTFRGTKIEVYGTISSNSKTVMNNDSFSIDGGPPVYWWASPRTNPTFNVRMFNSPTLKDGTHVLVMRTLVNNSDTFIDFLNFMPSVGQLSSSTPVALLPLSTSGTTTSSEAGETESFTSPPSNSSSQSSQSSHFPITKSVDVSLIASASSTQSHELATPSGGSGGNSTSLTSTPRSNLGSGTIAGISIAVAAVVVAALGLLIKLYLKRRQERFTLLQESDDMITPFSPTSMPTVDDRTETMSSVTDRKDAPPPYGR